MRPIKGKIFSHVSADREDVPKRGGVSRLGAGILPRYVDVDTVRRGEAPVVRGFGQLWRLVAEVAVRNHGFLTRVRGQGSDFRNGGGKTTLLPSLFRPPPGQARLTRSRLERRVALLLDCEREVRARRSELQPHLGVSDFPEFARAILQHYGVCPTPLLDLTQSLRVACSFALMGSRDGTGTVYVLGMPFQLTGCISYSVRERAVFQVLLASCPPDALRPLYQEGNLVGSFPNDPELHLQNRPRTDLDLACRLLAKYRIAGGGPEGTFWKDDPHFAALPRRVLLPDHDPFGARVCELLAPVVERHAKNFPNNVI